LSFADTGHAEAVLWTLQPGVEVLDPPALRRRAEATAKCKNGAEIRDDRAALRFYEEQGIVTPARGRDGRRRYDRAALRTLAFVALARELGFGIAAIRAAVHPGPDGWAAAVDAQVAELDAVIARARRARELLVEARDCPAPSPVHDCPNLHAELDALLGAGAPRPATR
jgi:DNA-binding transcriptional MerR regulator